MKNVVEIFLLGWLLGGFVANVITTIVQKVIRKGDMIKYGRTNS